MIDFIEKSFGQGQPSNQGLNFSVLCPICKENKGSSYDKKKLVIRTDNSLCHCWVCGYKSRNLLFLIKKYHNEYLNEYIECTPGIYIYDI